MNYLGVHEIHYLGVWKIRECKWKFWYCRLLYEKIWSFRTFMTTKRRFWSCNRWNKTRTEDDLRSGVKVTWSDLRQSWRADEVGIYVEVNKCRHNWPLRQQISKSLRNNAYKSCETHRSLCQDTKQWLAHNNQASQGGWTSRQIAHICQ